MGYAMKQREGGRVRKRRERQSGRGRERVEERKTGASGSGELAGIRGLGWMG